MAKKRLIPVMCVAPGCHEVVYDFGECRCEKHRKQQKSDSTKAASARRKEQRQSSEYAKKAKIYDSKDWRTISIKKRTVDPFCEDCLEQGKYVIADVVDHVIEIEDDPKLAFVWSNLRSLCHSCHNKKTRKARESRKPKGEDFI